MIRKLLLAISFIVAGYSIEKDPFILGKDHDLELKDFYEIVYQNRNVVLSENSANRLKETREFVNYLLDENIKVYGLTTGFADLRNFTVSPKDAAQLSVNIIKSHDAGIGSPLGKDVVLGAMLCRANSLSKGNSAFDPDNLKTLIAMINAKIIPIIPEMGSLGASGDLAFLARLGRAMMGDNVPVCFEGKIVPAKEALEAKNIKIFSPLAKEGLALTNGTSFMASMLAIAYLQEIHQFENMLALQGLFLNASKCVDGAFNECIQDSRGQLGQIEVARLLREFLNASPFVDRGGTQNDYCMRCLPQILGPKIELIKNVYQNVRN
jgi:histidine ammonia-lyase